MWSNRRAAAAMLVALSIPVIAGCGADAPATADGAAQAAAVAPRDLVVHTRDFQFVDMPETLPAGLTNIRLVNEGPDFHHIWLVRLEDGHTLADLMAAMAGGGPMPEWAVDVGGPNTPGLPGEETNALVDLVAGNYAVLCVIPAPDGEMHVMKGMVRELTVEPSDAEPAVLPEPDVVMTLNDYTFELNTPITAGTRTIRVQNVAAQPHEVLIVKLDEGRTPMEMLQFIESREGTPPGKVVGGTTGIAQGGMNQVTIDFEQGDYALICFVPDAGDGQPHFVHGMIDQIHVM